MTYSLKLCDIHVCDHDGDPWLEIGTPLCVSRVDEMNYKQVASLIDENFLSQGVRASVLQGVRLANIQDSSRSMTWFVRSSEFAGNSTFYGCTVRFKEWDDVIDDSSMKPIERARKLMFTGNIELNCTCPSFLYHGYRYLLTQKDASIFPENRPPKKTNPQHRGIVCKHLNRVIKAFPFYSSDLAKYIKENHEVEAGKTRDWDIKSKTADAVKKSKKAKTITVDYEDIT